MDPRTGSVTAMNELRSRLLSSVVLVAIGALAIYFGALALAFLWTLLAIAILDEWRQMKAIPRAPALWCLYLMIALACALLITSGLDRGETRPISWLHPNLSFAFANIAPWAFGPWYGAAILLVALALGAAKRFFLPTALVLHFALCAIGVTLLSGPNAWLLWLALLGLVVATDSFAYFAGKSIGGPKVWPAISPNKTLAGAFGGLAGAMLVTLYLPDLLRAFDIEIGSQRLLTLSGNYSALAITLLLSIVSQGGDFFESALKRRYKVKDSGSLLPGHGGFFDRFDGFFAVVIVYAALLVVAELRT